MGQDVSHEDPLWACQANEQQEYPVQQACANGEFGKVHRRTGYLLDGNPQ